MKRPATRHRERVSCGLHHLRLNFGSVNDGMVLMSSRQNMQTILHGGLDLSGGQGFSHLNSRNHTPGDALC
jgi:hypothetical protein